MNADQIAHNFAYHAPKDDAVRAAHEKIRYECGKVAMLIDKLCVDGTEGREKALAITKLEEAMMWANASIARHGINDGAN